MSLYRHSKESAHCLLKSENKPETGAAQTGSHQASHKCKQIAEKGFRSVEAQARHRVAGGATRKHAVDRRRAEPCYHRQMRYWQNHTGSTYRPDRPAEKRDRILLQHRRIPARHQEQGQVSQNGDHIPLYAGLLGHYHRRCNVCQHHARESAAFLPRHILSQ